MAVISEASDEMKEFLRCFIFPTFTPRLLESRRKRCQKKLMLIPRETLNQKFMRLMKKKYPQRSKYSVKLATEVQELLL